MTGIADQAMEALVAEASAGDEPLIPAADTPATETPSAATPQATESKPTAWTYEDFIARYESDPDFKSAVDEKHIKVRANALFQSQRDRQEKAARKAQLSEAAADPDRAAGIVKAELAKIDAEEAQATRTVAQVQTDLERIAEDEDDAPYYAQLYDREGGEKLNARLSEDAQAGLRWIKREVRKLAVEAEAKKVTPKLAEAMAAHRTNETLASLPVPPTATAPAGLSDTDFLKAYAAGKEDNHARAAKLLGI